jgi:broad specificity phosphatase PhoE
MKRAILARHGESTHNTTGTLGGDPPLSKAGRDQAEALGERLPHIDLAITSGFRRTVQTAAIAAPTAPRLAVADLRDIHFGRYEGGVSAAYLQWAWTAGPAEPCPGGGESRTNAVRRYLRAWNAVLARPETTLLVVAHGLTIRYLLDARAARGPAQRAEPVPPAEPFVVERAEIEAGVTRLEAWLSDPHW